MAFDITMTGTARTRGSGTPSAAVRQVSALQSQMWTDLEETFFNTAEFAEYEQISYLHKGSGSTETYDAIYDDPSMNVSPGTTVEVITPKPQVMIPYHTMRQYPDMGDEITVRGIVYKIDEIVNDGVGVITLFLVRKTGSAN
jgi:hypothetical protein